jgi:hypothetical protein
MGQIKEPPLVKLFAGVITAGDEYTVAARKGLEEKLGPIDYESPVIPFDFTKYYEPEMGANLNRIFWSFEKLIHPSQLPEIKVFTNELELSISSPDRKINLDPGYLTGAKMILATTKDYSHRIYLDKGIYGEVTLRFLKHSFSSFDYTYRDYATEQYIAIFNEIRRRYMAQIQPESHS